MRARRAGRWRRGFRPADIDRALGLHSDGAERLVDAAVDEPPGAPVLGLPLAPHHLGVGILRQPGAQPVDWERIELLDGQDGDVFDLALAPLRPKNEVDLAASPEDTPNILRA